MAERIYIRGRGGQLEPLKEEPFPTEDELQLLIAEHPELLDGEQIRPGDPRRWLLITREKGIAETSDSGARWAVDHLIVDQDAVPTLVEVKRGSNPEIRRTVVGQVLEYAAHAARTWTADQLRRTFEESTGDPGEVLGGLLRTDGEPDADRFWERVSTNLSARRMRLLFVADEIPDELERVVEFLNEQMPNIEVLAVEIKQFRGEQTQTLVPRVLGRTAKAPSQGSTSRYQSLNRETFLGEFTSEEERSAAARLLDVAQKAGAEFAYNKGCISIRVRCSLWKGLISVAWLVPPSRESWTEYFTFGTADILDNDPAPEEELSAILQRWANQFSTDDFTKEVLYKGVTAWSVDYDAAAQHIDLLANRLANVLSELKSL